MPQTKAAWVIMALVCLDTATSLTVFGSKLIKFQATKKPLLVLIQDRSIIQLHRAIRLNQIQFMASARSCAATLTRMHRIAMNSPELPELYRPPINRAMRVLDRSFFQKTIPIAAATVFEDRNISLVRGKVQSAGHLFGVFSIKSIVPDETVPGRKCVLLQPGIRATGLFDRLIASLHFEAVADIRARPFDLVSNHYGAGGE
jgi:hypothetical protein